MMTEKKQNWFPIRRSGLGWGLPCSWQGWVVLLIYIVLVVDPPGIIPLQEEPMFYSVYVGILTLMLIGIVSWKSGRR